jgi:hypothetical protein
MNQNHLTLLHWNCNGIFNKLEMFKVHIDRFKPHIISFNEIKLTEMEANKCLSFNGYSSIFKCREQLGSFGGGFALLVREDVNYEKYVNEAWLHREVVWVKVMLGKKETLIFSIYN